MAVTHDLSQRIVNMVLKYRPEKMDSIDKLFAVYKGREEELLQSMVSNYGPEPSPEEATALRQRAPNLPRSGGAMDFSQRANESSIKVSSPRNNHIPYPTSPRRSNQYMVGGGEAVSAVSRLSYRDRLVNMYRFYNPKNTCNVERLLVMCAGKEEALIRSLVQKYGPEPTPNMLRALQEANGVHRRVSTGEYRARLANMYMKYNRKKLETLDQDLSLYRGREDQLFLVLTRLYGPEPSDEEMLFIRRQHAYATNYGMRISAIFAKHCPSRLSEVNSLLQTYRGHEDALIRELVVRYGAEPSSEEAISLIERARTTHIETTSSSTSCNTTTSSSNNNNNSGAASVNGGSSWNGLDNRTKLIVFYTKYNPSIVPHVESILSSCPGQENKLFSELVTKYGAVPSDEEIAIILNNLAERERRTKRLLVSLSFRERLYIFYMKYAPEKLSTVEGILQQYTGREQQCICDMVARYGPEPGEHEIPVLQRQAILYMNQVDAKRVTTQTTQQHTQQTLLIQRHGGHQEPVVQQKPHTPAPPRRDYRGDLLKYYTVYEPQHIHRVDEVLLQFRGKEDQLMEIMFEKYGVVPTGDVKVQQTTVSQTTVCTLTPEQVARYRDRVTRFFQTYDASKVSTVDAVMQEYAGREEELMMTLLARYGPEPMVNVTSTTENHLQISSKRPSTAAYRARVQAMYTKYDRDMLGSVDVVLAQYIGKEDELMQRLIARYGPEPTADSKLSVEVATSSSEKLSYRTRLIHMFMRYDPEKLSSVDATLAQYIGKEEQLISELVRVYGPEPSVGDVAWHTYTNATSPRASASKSGFKSEGNDVRSRMNKFVMKYDPEMIETINQMFSQYAEQIEKKIATITTEKPPAAPVAAETVVKVSAEATVKKDDYRRRASNFLTKYDPDKLFTLPEMLKYFDGQEDEMIRTLLVQYGPEPSDAEIAALRFTNETLKKGKEADLYRSRLVRFYTKYDPEKLSNVDAVLSSFAGREDEMIRAFLVRYGTEPTEEEIQRLSMKSDERKLSYRERVLNFLIMYDATKADQVDAMLTSFRGEEERLIRTLQVKYGPEPTPEDVACKRNAVKPPAPVEVEVGVQSVPVMVSVDIVQEDFQARLINFFTFYNPELLSSVPQMLITYKGRETDLLARLSKQYGPEPTQEQIDELNFSLVNNFFGQSGGIDYQARVVNLLQAYDPASLGATANILANYVGQEDQMMRDLVLRYGPEPLDNYEGGRFVSTYRVYHHRLTRFFAHYAPDRLCEIDAELSCYLGQEEEYIASLVQQYGPESFGTLDNQNFMSGYNLNNYNSNNTNNLMSMIAGSFAFSNENRGSDRGMKSAARQQSFYL